VRRRQKGSRNRDGREYGERRRTKERRSERHRSLVALSTRAPPSSTSAPKTPTLAAARDGQRVVENARDTRVIKGAVIRKREYVASGN